MTSAPAFAVSPHLDVRSVQIGEGTALIIDNFLQDPAALKQVASEAAYEPYPGMAQGTGYPGVRAWVPADYTSELMAIAEPLLKQNFGVPAELLPSKSACAFSLLTVPGEQLSPLQRIPHFDASAPHFFAVLLYLCDEQHGGTSFHRHRATGLQRITPTEVDRYGDIVERELHLRPPAHRHYGREDWQYEFLGRIPAKFNRLVAYHGSLLHNAFIEGEHSIDANPATGRLTVNTFIDFSLA